MYKLCCWTKLEISKEIIITNTFDLRQTNWSCELASTLNSVTWNRGINESNSIEFYVRSPYLLVLQTQSMFICSNASTQQYSQTSKYISLLSMRTTLGRCVWRHCAPDIISLLAGGKHISRSLSRGKCFQSLTVDKEVISLKAFTQTLTSPLSHSLGLPSYWSTS